MLIIDRLGAHHMTIDLNYTAEIQNSASRIYSRRLKRAFDVVACILSAPVILPIIAILALLAKRDGGPAFYSQERIGRNGRTFRCWKLRTMVVDAEKRLDDYLSANPVAAAEWSEKQKLEDDPRVTEFGRFARRFSLDELPQLWNVFIGDMSIVGPRPMMVEQGDLYSGRAYYQMRPGLTGYWQISDRSNGSFIGRVSHDERYYEEMSFRTDTMIVLRTVGVVFKATGV